MGAIADLTCANLTVACRCGELSPLDIARDCLVATYPFNPTQQPAASVPGGLAANGLPIGVQIVGPLRADDVVLRAARAIERALPMPQPSL